MQLTSLLTVWGCLFTIAAGTKPIILDQLAGVIVLFETSHTITPSMVLLKNEYINYVITELNNQISHDYESVFLGFAIRFTDLNTIRDKVEQYETIHGSHGQPISPGNDQHLYDKFCQMLINYKAKQLQFEGIKLNILPDTSVTTYHHNDL